MYDTIILRFEREGQARPQDLLSIRDRFAHSVFNEMKAKGYLPLLDLEPSWWVCYVPQRNVYKVRYADQGVYYGKEDIDLWRGWLLGELIPTVKKLSKASSVDSD